MVASKNLEKLVSSLIIGPSWVLFTSFRNNTSEEKTDVRDFVFVVQWNKHKLSTYLSDEDTVNYIYEDTKPPILAEWMDKAWWMGNSSGTFSFRSAWELIRAKNRPMKVEKQLWVKGLPLKINFFFQNAWRGRIATDENLRRINIKIVSKCWCCEGHSQETMEHPFLAAPIAKKLWKYYANWVGINMVDIQLQMMVKRWWTVAGNKKIQQLCKAIPPLILWDLWKRRNCRRHGWKVTLNTMIHNIQSNARWLIEVLNSRMRIRS